MTFALPADPTVTDVALTLRMLEQDTQKLPANVRAAMIAGAQDIEGWRTLAEDVLRDLQSVVALRISMMASESAHAEQQKHVRTTLVALTERLKARLA